MPVYHAGSRVSEIRHAGARVARVICQAKQIFPADNLWFDGLPETRGRIVSDAGKKRFEFMFLSPEILTGNPASGWTDAGHYCHLICEWSPDLVHWSLGKFSAAPTPIVSLPDGTYEYWLRAENPLDAAVKTGVLACSNTNNDSRNNGFTSVVIAGVVQSLPNYPYDMSVGGTAALLQADLIAAGWAGTIVTGSTAESWQIYIPAISYTSYSQSSCVVFPGYQVPGLFGIVTVSSLPFVGAFVDSDGTPIYHQAFGRLGISKGPRYS